MAVMHVDANSAYLSWTAAALLEKGYPIDIRTVPAVIAGNPKNRHGIILAKSIPAKKAGIGTGTSLFEAKQKCPELMIFPPEYDLYLACSDSMYSILGEYSPLVQRYSVDESFVDVKGCEGHFPTLYDMAMSIKERIKGELGFTVNVGVGPNKLLAKMAGELKKPDMVHTLLTREEMESKMWPLDVSELFMVGRASARKLHKINVNTIGDLAVTDPVLLRSLMKSHGQLIWEYANGIDGDRVMPENTIIQKGIGNSMTIKYDVLDSSEAAYYILALTDRVAGRLRKHGCKTSLISVSVRNSDMAWYTHQLKLPFFTDDTTRIYRYAMTLFRECWKGEPIRQLGVRVSDFVRKDEYQLSMLDIESIEKEEAVNAAVDSIRERFGDRAIYRGVFANTDYNPIEGGVNNGNFLMMGGFRQ